MTAPLDRSTTRRILALANLGLLLALLSLPAAVPARQGGFALPGLDGGQLTAGDLARGSTVLVVWASWSPKCRDIVPQVNALASRWSGRARVATVNFQEDADAVRRFLAGQSLQVPVYLDRDGSFSKENAVTTLPGLIVYRDGTPVYRNRLPADPDAVLSGLLPAP